MKRTTFAILVVILLLTAVNHTVAQDDVQINTTFSAGCLEPLGETHYRLHFNYVSDGVETYSFIIGDVISNDPDAPPYAGTAFSNVPTTFTTSEGYHDDWYLDAHSEDSMNTFHLLFTNNVGTADLPLDTWDVAMCDVGLYPTTVPETPEPTSEYVPRPTDEPTEVPEDQTVCPAGTVISISVPDGQLTCV